MPTLAALGSPAALALHAAHTARLANIAKEAASVASTASSVLSNVPAPVAAGAGLLLAVGAGGYFIYKEVKEHQLEKIGAKIVEANHTAKPFFNRITVPGFSEVTSWPLPFEVDDEKNPKNLKALPVDEDDIKAIGETKSHQSEIGLEVFVENVDSAISELKAYYETLDKTGVTARVLAHILHLIDDCVLKFQGYDLDIAYLTALINFIDKYASTSAHGAGSQHFSRLKGAYQYLRKAKDELKKHKETRSFTYDISELKDACIKHSKVMIRNIVQVILPNKHWGLLPNLVIQKLAKDGTVTEEHVKRAANVPIVGVVATHDAEVKLENSIITDWVIHLSRYYLKSLTAEATLTENEILPPNPDLVKLKALEDNLKESKTRAQDEQEIAKIKAQYELFAIPNLKKLKALEDGLKKSKNRNQDEQEIIKIKAQLEALKRAFKNSENFLTRKFFQGKKDKEGRYIVVETNEDIVESLTVIAGMASVTHRLITHICRSLDLLKGAQMLGELYVKSPEAFREVFAIFDALTQQLKDDVARSQAAIKLREDDRMQLAELSEFYEKVESSLKAIETDVATLEGRIIKSREKERKTPSPDARADTIRNINDAFKQSAKFNGIDIATLKSKGVHSSVSQTPGQFSPSASGLPADLSDVREESKIEEGHDVNEHLPDPHTGRSITEPLSSSSSAEHSQSSALLFSPRSPLSPLSPPLSPPLSISSENNKKEFEIEKYRLILEYMETRINSIAENEKPLEKIDRIDFNREVEAYRELYRSLLNMHRKAAILYAKPDEEQQMKGEFNLKLTFKLCESTIRFLSVPRDERKDKAKVEALYTNGFHAELSETNTTNAKAIDEHSNWALRAAWQLFQTLTGIGAAYIWWTRGSIFKISTDSRVLANNADKAAENIKILLTAPSA